MLPVTDTRHRADLPPLSSFTERCRRRCRKLTPPPCPLDRNPLPANAARLHIFRVSDSAAVLQGDRQRADVAARLPRGRRPEGGRRLLVARLGWRRLPCRPRCCFLQPQVSCGVVCQPAARCCPRPAIWMWLLHSSAVSITGNIQVGAASRDAAAFIMVLWGLAVLAGFVVVAALAAAGGWKAWRRFELWRDHRRIEARC